jgi:hypothetical protein
MGVRERIPLGRREGNERLDWLVGGERDEPISFRY